MFCHVTSLLDGDGSVRDGRELNVHPCLLAAFIVAFALWGSRGDEVVYEARKVHLVLSCRRLSGMKRRGKIVRKKLKQFTGENAAAEVLAVAGAVHAEMIADAGLEQMRVSFSFHADQQVAKKL